MFRRFIAASAAVVLAALGSTSVLAQTYPDRPIRLIVPFPPGGGADLTARIAAEYLAPKFGQAVVVENRPGAATQLAMDLVAKAKPDGYTLLWTTSDGISVLPAVKPTISYKIPDDFAWIAGGLNYTLIMAVNAKLPHQNLQELLAYAKDNPGKVRYSSSGVGAGNHLAAELIAHAAGVKMLHIPYQGAAPAVQAAIGGFVDFVMVATSSMKPYTDAGQLRALATSDVKRSPLFPETPTLEQAGLKGINVVLVYGMLAPPGTPEPIQQKLRDSIGEMLKDAKVIEQIKKFGFEPAFRPGEEFKSFMVDDLKKWTGVAKAANIEIKD